MFLIVLAFVLVILAFIAQRNDFRFKILSYLSWEKQGYKLPKGPRGWPFLGNLVQMVKHPHKKLSKWAKKYGKLYTIFLANKQALVITDSKLLKEIFGHNASTGKFKTDTMLLVSQGPYGVLNTEGKAFQEQKQFCMKTLIKFGFGSNTLEPLMLHEIQQVSEWIDRESRKNGGQVILNDVLKQASNNALWTIISSERIELEDRKVVNLLDNFLDSMQYTVKTGLGFFPWLKYLSPRLSGYTAFDKACKDLHKFIREQVDDHEKSFVDGITRDVIDSYLEKILHTEDPSSSFYGEVGKINTVSTLVELFTGSGDTTSATINWLIFYLSWDPEVQRKLCEEIDKVIGENRDPSLMDKAVMPYTEAVILETFRCSSLLPLGIIHELTEDLQFQGYHLPKDLLLIPNLYGCHHSKDIWGDPSIFRPERFLEKPELRDAMVQFQPGKRSCPGEPLAKDAVFLFTTKLFQKWKVAPSHGVSKDKYFQPDDGVLTLPKRLAVVMRRREHT